MAEIVYYRGDTKPRIVTLREKTNDDTLGAVIDITSCSFIMTVDPKKNPTDNVNNLFQIVGVISGDPLLGKVVFAPAVGDTDQAIATYYYDIQMTDASGYISTIALDKFKIIQEITK